MSSNLKTYKLHEPVGKKIWWSYIPFLTHRTPALKYWNGLLGVEEEGRKTILHCWVERHKSGLELHFQEAYKKHIMTLPYDLVLLVKIYARRLPRRSRYVGYEGEWVNIEIHTKTGIVYKLKVPYDKQQVVIGFFKIPEIARLLWVTEPELEI